jgi:hypothetical protein
MNLKDYAICKNKLKRPQLKLKKKKGAVVLEIQREKKVDLESKIKWYLDFLPSDGISTVEAEKRASIFLQAMGDIAQWRLKKAEEKSKAESLERTTYGSLLNTLKSGSITENKLKVESNSLYQNSRETFEKASSEEDYLKHISDLFTNAHIFYRQLLKGVSNGGI